MMRRHTPALSAAITALACALGMAGCSTGGSPVATGSAGATVTASPTPTVNPYNELKPMVDAAALSAKEMGASVGKDEATASKLEAPCYAFIDAQQVASRYWSYDKGPKLVFSHSVVAYHPAGGSAVVDQIRPSLKACQKWVWRGQWDMEVLEELPVSKPQGADNTFAYCHKGTITKDANKGLVNYICEGLVSRGHLVASINVKATTLIDSQGGLIELLPFAAAALVKAVP